MAKWLALYVHKVDTTNGRIGQYLRWLVLIILGVMIAGTVARYAFNAPFPWDQDVRAYLFGSYFLLGGAYTFLCGGHVRMDALYSRWSPKKKAIADIATFALILPFCGIMIQRGIPYAISSVLTGEHSVSAAKIPVAPIKIILVVAIVLLLLQVISSLIKDIYFVRTGKVLE